MSYLITSSLIGSIKWYQECPYSWKEKAYSDLSNMLNRKWTTPSKPAQRGITFENYVYRLLSKSTDIDSLNCSNYFKQVLHRCNRGIFQEVSKSFIVVDEIEYCLYQKADVIFDNEIIDIKTTVKFNKDKYLNSFQHIIYLHNTQKRKFTYLVAVFEENTDKIIDLQEVRIQVFENQLKEYENKIIAKIKEINKFFEEHIYLGKAYCSIYSKPKKG
ncbi:MAG: hypothetical protein P8Y70_00225 [Candidatus Lokiarchaeota archaeon]